MVIKVIALVHVSFCAVLAQVPGQTARPEAFNYERPVIPGASGPNRLLIDVPLLSRAAPFPASSQTRAGSSNETVIIDLRGLADLRIYDASNREVPYLLVSPPIPEPLWSDGRILPVASTKKSSGLEVDLGRPQRVDRLRLAGLPAPFLKRVRLEGSGERTRWTLLVPEGTVFDLPDEKLRQLELGFTPGEFRYLRVTWDDRSSGRLPPPSSISARLVRGTMLPPPLRASLSFERRGSEPGRSRYRLRLPGAHLPIVALELVTAGGDVLREALVTEAQLSGSEVVPVLLGSATLRRAVRGELAAAELRIPIRTPREAQLDLTIEDGDNPPLELTGVSAVFAHLPWIYFESEGAGTLMARFGYPDLVAPRYDLEALRDSIPKLRTSEARWEDVRERKPEGERLLASSQPGAGASIDAASFRFSRQILASPPGLNFLQLDAEVLAHSGLSDLRIAGRDGRQIPYLFEKLAGPLTVELPPPEKIQAPESYQSAKGSPSVGRSFYRIRFPHENLPSSRLVLKTPARVFRRSVTVVIEKNPANERQEPWTARVAQADWSHADPETPAPVLTLSLPSLKTAEAMLVVDEGDNTPLAIETPRLLLPSYRIRFFRGDEAELTLLYGGKDVEAPRYDLALLAPRLVGAAAEETSLGPEGSSAQAKGIPFSKQLFWGVLTAAVLVLVFLIGYLVRKGEGGKPT